LVARLLRPHIGGEGHSESEHARAAALVAEHGVDSLDPFALRADKSFHFAAGGFLAYRTVRGTAVISGDPIGPEGAAPAILESFTAAANRRGWAVAMTGAGARHLARYRELGFQTLCIGEEAVVDPAGFSLDGARMKTVRKAVGRQQRRGWSIDVIPGHELDEPTVAQLDAVDREWRSAQPRLTGFAMTLGRLWGADEDARSLYATGRDPEGAIRAFVRFVVYRGGLSLDVMRRVGESPNGLTESLVVAVIEHARAEGLRAVSLNFAGFAHLMGPDRPLTRRQRALRWVLARSHERFQLERLVTFNKKFLPAWQPRYLVHQGSLDLPVAGLRVLQAEAYLRAPRSPRLSARWEPAVLPRFATTPTVLPGR
jgi:lysyl-tRNA synthetase class 2